ncbi:DUF4328 domain-containing protein [Kitasatospora sp. NPDC101183]|uniref:DUF4328 domain-containing protein n=1 Tax=Kitasatospora sp. NPDC101183 TaxID=3364100 RepID=UPI00382CF190
MSTTDFHNEIPRPQVRAYSGRAVDPRRLGVAAQVLVGAQSALQIVLGLTGGSRSDTFRALAPVSYPLWIATIVVFLCWFRRCRLNAEVFAPGTQKFSYGFAVGAWFIPLAMWWIPRRIALDTWRASGPAGGSWVVEAWWAAWLAKTLGGVILVCFVEDRPTPYSPYDQVMAVLLGVLAVLMIRQLTARQHAKATGTLAAAPFGGRPTSA